MTGTGPITLFSLLLIVYVMAVSGMNLIAFLISDFYCRKFDQPSPRLGFLITITMSLILICLTLIAGQSDTFVQALQSFLLIGSGTLSSYNAVGLYLTMRKVRR